MRPAFEAHRIQEQRDRTGRRSALPELQPSGSPRKPTNARHGCYASIWQESHRVSVMIRRSPIALGMVIDPFAVFASSF